MDGEAIGGLPILLLLTSMMMENHLASAVFALKIQIIRKSDRPFYTFSFLPSSFAGLGLASRSWLAEEYDPESSEEKPLA